MPHAVTSVATEPAQMHRVIHDYFAAIRARDGAAWCATFEAEGELIDPAGAEPRRGRPALAAFFDGFTALFAEMDFVPRAIYACGDSAAVCWEARCVARSGAEARASGVDVFEFGASGRIRRLTGWWDPAPLLAIAKE